MPICRCAADTPKIDVSDRSYESADNHKSLLQVRLDIFKRFTPDVWV